MKTENLSVLRIHKLLSEHQYNKARADGKIEPNELYLIPDNTDLDYITQLDMATTDKKYRKWKSGFIELWLKTTVKIAASGSAVVSIDFPSSAHLEDTISAYCQVSFRNNNNMGYIVDLYTNKIIISIDTTSVVDISTTIDVYISGKWF